jgi:hypothetical protein
LEALAANYSNLQLVFVTTGGGEAADEEAGDKAATTAAGGGDGTVVSGGLNAQTVGTYIPAAGKDVFGAVCGPPGFNLVASSILRKAGYSSANVFAFGTTDR